MKTQTTVQQPAVSSGSSSPLVQVSGALTMIIVFILLAAWLAKRVGLAGKGVAKGLKVCASCNLGPRERVVVIDVENARLVLGVTASQITHLYTLPPAPIGNDPAPAPPADFQSLMKNLLKRNGKA